MEQNFKDIFSMHPAKDQEDNLVMKEKESTNMNIEQNIRDVINSFAKKGIVFSNEQDFQFEMALAFKNGNYGVKNVKLETISFDKSTTWENYELENYNDFENVNGRSICPGFSFLIVEVIPD